MPPSAQDDFTLLSALVVPLIVGACVAFVVVMATGSFESPPHPVKRSIPRTRKRPKQESFHEWELIISRSTPVDVIEQIIDYVQEDKRTLKACALVGRAWKPRAYYHLHSSLTIRRGGSDPYKLGRFPAVARCIRRVAVRDGLWNELNQSVLVKLGYVERLRLGDPHGVSWRTITLTDLPNFPSLVELRLDNVSFPTREELFSALARIPKLTSLYADLTPVNYIDADEEALLHPGNVSTPRFSLPLSKIRLSVPTSPGTTPREILAIAGDILKELSISIITISNPLIVSLNCTLHLTTQAISVLGLHHSTSLHTLSLHFLWGDSLWYASTPRTEDFASSLLSCVHSPHLRTLQLHLTVPLDMDHRQWLRYLDVRFLDAFANPRPDSMRSLQDNERVISRSKGLQELRLTLILMMGDLSTTAHADIQRHVEEQLPELKKRKMFRIKIMSY